MYKFFLVIILFVFGTANAQKLRKGDKVIVAALQKHVQYLSSDELEGRRTGTEGEQKAMQYISDAFKSIGLQPKGSNNYYQLFEMNEGNEIKATTHLVVDGQELRLHKDYFPFVFSANNSLEALPLRAIKEVDMPWFVDVKQMIEGNSNNPHFNLEKAIYEEAVEAKGKGATALFVFNTSATKDNLAFNKRWNNDVAPIPVIYLTEAAMKKYFADVTATSDIKLKVEIAPKIRTGNNVIGFIDNNAASTVVIGAHFDHLGYGEDGNSMQRGQKEIHNGADDNASGIALMLELARMLKASDLRGNNYLFIAFSGEELGLIGSKYFTTHPTVDINSINYMINLDMVGRVDKDKPVVTVGGYGTSAFWPSAYAVTGKKGLYTGNLQFKFDSSGTGPSDHTSFYRKNIPVLFYFTGLHSDYHKPTDDADKINYIGQWQLAKHIYSLIEAQSKQNSKLVFTPTKEVATTTSASFNVTLGIMPDYSYTGNGVRIDGVSSERPAQKAGLKTGDVIVKLGNYTISTMENYMQALGKFEKGDTTTVYFNRGAENLSTSVVF